MDELRERRLRDGRAERPRIASVTARVDAGEAGALEALERRVRGDYEDLVREGRTRLADEAWAWALERVREVEFVEREEYEGAWLAEAPRRWTGLRVRVSYLAGGGPQKPSSLAGRLEDVCERGIRVAVDELEEERDGDDPASAGSIVRRVRSERLVCWPALLSVQPLPVRAVGEGGSFPTAPTRWSSGRPTLRRQRRGSRCPRRGCAWPSAMPATRKDGGTWGRILTRVLVVLGARM